MREIIVVFLIGMLFAGILPAEEASPVAAPLRRKGQWVEWEITLPPQTKTKTEKGIAPPILRLADQSSEKTEALEKRISYRITIESKAEDGTARITIQTKIGEEIDEVKDEKLDALTFLCAASSPPPDVKFTNKPGTIEVQGKTLQVSVRKWESKEGKKISVERWDAIAIPFGPARMRIEGFDMRVVGFGDGAEEAPTFPLVKEEEKPKAEETPPKTTPKEATPKEETAKKETAKKEEAAE